PSFFPILATFSNASSHDLIGICEGRRASRIPPPFLPVKGGVVHGIQSVYLMVTIARPSPTKLELRQPNVDAIRGETPVRAKECVAYDWSLSVRVRISTYKNGGFHVPGSRSSHDSQAPGLPSRCPRVSVTVSHRTRAVEDRRVLSMEPRTQPAA